MRRLSLLLLALTVVVLAVWMLAREDGGDPDAGASGLLDARDSSARGAGLQGAGRPKTEQVEPAPDPDDTATAVPEGVSVPLRVTVAVAGERSPTSFDPAVSLHVWQHALRIESIWPSGGAEASVRTSGPLVLDLAAAFVEMRKRRERRDLWIVAEHPGYVPVRLRVPVPEPADLLAGEAALDPVTVTLRPAGCVTGVVEDVDGLPRPGASALLYPMRAAGPERQPVDEVGSDEEGRFRLRFGRGGRYLIVGAWQDYRLGRRLVVTAAPRPASRVLDLAVGNETTNVRLRLLPSLAIRGVVKRVGVPVADADLAWSYAGDARPLSVWRESECDDSWGLVYVEGGAHWGWDDVDTDEDGNFQIVGLSPLPYRLTVEHVRGTHIHRRATEYVVQEVVPPRDDVVFDLPFATLRVRVRAAGEPVWPGMLHVSDVGMDPEIGDDVLWGTYQGEADPDGLFEVGLSPRCLYVVRIEDPRFEPYWHQLTAPAAHETLDFAVDLRPAHPKPRLVVTLESAVPIDRAGFGFYEPGVDVRSRTPGPLRNVDAIEGRFAVEDLEPGRYLLHVRPGRFWNAPPGDWVEAVQEVVVPEAGETEIRVPVEKGGRLHLTVTDVDGRHLPAKCRIADVLGHEIPAWFRTESPMGHPINSVHKLSGHGACWVEPVLRAGDYTVELTLDGYEPQERQVRLEAGKPTTLRVVLERGR